MTQAPVVRQLTGQAQLDQASAMNLFANLAGSPHSALTELLDNGRDAGANLMCVVISPKSVEVFDNGHGMVPGMHDDDRVTLENFREDVRNGKIPDIDVRDLLRPSSGRSFEWFMKKIARSQKRPEKGDTVVGFRGIGALTVRIIGATSEWHSKPARDLAEEYYGQDEKEPPIAILHPPTADAVDRGDMDYRIQVTRQTKLVDPMGRVHPSGTRIIITDLVSDLGLLARPAQLVDELSKRYGTDIREGKLKIVVIDKYTAAGKSVPKGEGRTLKVPPLQYKGVLVFQESGSILDGRGIFNAELYYNPAGRNEKVSFLRKGIQTNVDGIFVTSLTQLDVEPFNTGKLTGFIEFPDLSEVDFPLNPQKSLPQNSPARTEYIRVIRGWRRQIQEAIDATHERARDEGTRQAMREIASDTMDAIREVDVLANALEVRNPLPGTTRPPQVNRNLLVHIVDEYGRPLEGVAVELKQGCRKLLSLESNAAGNINFGQRQNGLYTFVLVVPHGMKTIDGVDDYPNMEVSDDKPGYSLNFKLRTGSPAPPEKLTKRQIGARITIIQRTLPDVTQPYSTDLLGRGQIHINAEHAELRWAVETDDEEGRDQIIAICVANAIVEYTMKDYPPHEQLMLSAVLATKLLRIRRIRKSTRPSRRSA